MRDLAADAPALLPSINSDDEYESAVQKLELWLPAAYEICRREHIQAGSAPRRDVVGSYPTIIIPPGHVIKLYGPWEGGLPTFRAELNAYQLMAADPDLPVSRYVAHGTIDDHWSYIVTTFVPGEPLLRVRELLSEDALIEVARWTGRFVRRLRSVPLDTGIRDEAWNNWTRTATARRANIRQWLLRWGSLPGWLLAQVETWMPAPEQLIPGNHWAALVHADLHDEHVLGDLVDGRLMPTGVIDFNRAFICHPYYELGPLCRWMFRGDRGQMLAFLDSADLPGKSDPSFPKLALAYVLLHGADQLSGLPQLDRVTSLDELAAQLFAA